MPSPIDVFHALLSIVGFANGAVLAESSALTMVVLLVAALVVVVASTRAAVQALHDSSAHPRRSIDISSPLPQSDPDASGHPRPRAPGHAAVVI